MEEVHDQEDDENREDGTFLSEIGAILHIGAPCRRPSIFTTDL